MAKLKETTQASLEQVEELLKQSVNAYVPPERKPVSTDPLPFEHHLGLVDQAEDTIQYISHEIERYHELLRIIENLQSHLRTQHEVLTKSNNPFQVFKPEPNKQSKWKLATFFLLSQLVIILASISVMGYFFYYNQ